MTHMTGGGGCGGGVMGGSSIGGVVVAAAAAVVVGVLAVRTASTWPTPAAASASAADAEAGTNPTLLSHEPRMSVSIVWQRASVQH